MIQYNNEPLSHAQAKKYTAFALKFKNDCFHSSIDESTYMKHFVFSVVNINQRAIAHIPEEIGHISS